MAWAASLPATEVEILAMLRAVATPLRENHAAEVLRVERLRHSVAGGNLQFGAIRPQAPSGATVAGHAAWVPALQNEAARLIGACTVAASHRELQSAAIATRYQILLAQFLAPGFLTSGEFLIDMGGHALMGALAAHLRGSGAPHRLADSFLANELFRVLISIYAPQTIYHPDDFEEIATILAQY